MKQLCDQAAPDAVMLRPGLLPTLFAPVTLTLALNLKPLKFSNAVLTALVWLQAKSVADDVLGDVKEAADKVGSAAKEVQLLGCLSVIEHLLHRRFCPHSIQQSRSQDGTRLSLMYISRD